MKYYLFFWKICIAVMVLIGINVLLDPKQSQSLLRVSLFGILPLILSMIFFLLKKKINTILITLNSLILLIVCLIFYEAYLINRGFNRTVNLEEIEDKQVCGNSFKNIRNLSVYPVGGISKKKIIFFNKENSNIGYRNNDRYGFNNENKIWNDKINTIFIGDSFTYGVDVNFDENFVEIYKKSIDKTLNLGCGGNGPIIEYATFVEYVKNLKLNPNYLFWVYYSGNDLTKDIISENKSYYKNYLKNNFSQNLPSKQKSINQIIQFFIEKNNLKTDNEEKIEYNLAKEYFSIFKFIKIRSKLGISKGYTKDNFEIFKSILNKVDEEMQKWDGELIFIFIPSQSRYANITSYYDEFFYDLPIKKFLKKKNIKYIDLNEKFRMYKDPSKFYKGHLNILGHKILSDAIFENNFQN